MSSSKSASKKRDKDDSNNLDLSATAIGNYVFQKTIGEGNFAKVKLATHKLTGQEVAVKVIDKSVLDEKKLSKLYREVKIMKGLHHPNIVKLYEVIETKNTVFLVMEYAAGGELYDYLVVHGKMKEKEARSKFRQILSAVSYCHQKRVIHRDLKAENLLLDANLDIKIADFGFSNYYDPEAKLDTFCGSPPYAAPELFQGRRYTGPEVDIWSMGVILYVLTTGCLPFDGKNLQEMRESVCRGKYRIPFYLTDTCEKLLRKFLVRDPVRRASLDMLIDDPWINESYSDSPISTDVSEKLEEDEMVIRAVALKYKIDREAVIKSIRDDTFDDIAALYYLHYYEKLAKKDNPGLTPMTPGGFSLPTPSFPSVKPSMVPIAENESVPVSPVSPVGPPILAAAPAPKESGKRRFTINTSRKDSPEKINTDPQSSMNAAQNSKLVPISPPKTAFPISEKKESSSAIVEESVQTTETRKRSTTIVGLLRNTAFSRSKTPQVDPVEVMSKKNDVGSNETIATRAGTASNDDGPRSLRFTFNSNTTSTKPPDEIIDSIKSSCDRHGITQRFISRYLIECQVESSVGKESIRFEVEVCKLPRLKNMHGLRFKRVSGSSSEYKDICEKLLTTVSL